jgi:hypothetical protein
MTYFGEYEPFLPTQAVPFRLRLKSPATFSLQSGLLYNKIAVRYGTAFKIQSTIQNSDLVEFKLTCLLAGQLQENCVLDLATTTVNVYFQSALALNTVFDLFITLANPKDDYKSGFLFETTASAMQGVTVVFQPQGSTQSIVQLDPAPVFYSLPTGVVNGPHNGITAGSVSVGHGSTGLLNWLELSLTFGRTDINSLVLELPGLYYDQTAVWGTEFSLGDWVFEDGQPYPCASPGAASTIKCVFKAGGDLSPFRIIITDLPAVSPLVFTVPLFNPSAAGVWVSARILAFAGTQPTDSLLGEKFAGSFRFEDMFQTVSLGTNLQTLTGSLQNAIPDKAPLASGEIALYNYITSSLGANGFYFLEVPLRLTTLTDPDVCELSFNALLHSHVFYYQRNGNVKAYLFRVGSLAFTTVTPIKAGNLVCKHYGFNLKMHVVQAPNVGGQFATITYSPSGNVAGWTGLQAGILAPTFISHNTQNPLPGVTSFTLFEVDL